MTDEWITKPTDQPDDYSDIEEPESWTVDDLVRLKNQYYNRFQYELHPSGKTATIQYCNYTLGYSGTKIKVNKETGGAVLKVQVNKQVVIQ